MTAANQEEARCVVCDGQIVKASIAVSVQRPNLECGEEYIPSMPATVPIYHCANCKLIYAEPPPESARDKIAIQH